MEYRVRVLFLDGSEKVLTDLDWICAKRKFLFYVSACLEFDNELSVRCINILRGDTCVRLYQNYSHYERRRKNIVS